MGCGCGSTGTAPAVKDQPEGVVRDVDRRKQCNTVTQGGPGCVNQWSAFGDGLNWAGPCPGTDQGKMVDLLEGCVTVTAEKMNQGYVSIIPVSATAVQYQFHKREADANAAIANTWPPAGVVSYVAHAGGEEGETGLPNAKVVELCCDGDGLSDVTICPADSDGDGLSDVAENLVHGTDPLNPDTDGDGLTDGQEVDETETDPLDADTDRDGLGDGIEVSTHGTDPNNPDSDGGGLTDGLEIDGSDVIVGGRDPLSAGDDNLPPVIEGDGFDFPDTAESGETIFLVAQFSDPDNNDCNCSWEIV